MEPIKTYFQTKFTVKDEYWKLFSSKPEEKKYLKKSLLTEAGKTELKNPLS